jgi:replicative DNA helicase
MSGLPIPNSAGSVAPAPSADAEVAALRVPPHSVEAEQSVLGAVLLDNTAWEKIGDVVREPDFYRHDHRLIWQHLARLLELVRGLPRPAIVFINAKKQCDALARELAAKGTVLLKNTGALLPLAKTLRDAHEAAADAVRERRGATPPADDVPAAR